jgi:hypothetical protein
MAVKKNNAEPLRVKYGGVTRTVTRTAASSALSQPRQTAYRSYARVVARSNKR